MELTREVIEVLAEGSINVVVGDVKLEWFSVQQVAKALLTEINIPKVWDNAPKEATKACVIFMRGKRDNTFGKSQTYTRELPKTRIDEIAEEAEDRYKRGAVGAGSLTDIIKSAIMKDREERETNR